MSSPGAADPGRVFLYSGGGDPDSVPGPNPSLHSPAARASGTGSWRSKTSQTRAVAAATFAERSPREPAKQDSGRQREASHLNGSNPSARYEAAGEAVSQWGQAIGNIEDARVAMDTLARAIDDAIYLDEDSYNQLAPQSAFTRTIQAQQRRVHQLEAELRRAREEAAAEAGNRQAAELACREKDVELENSSVVFKLHYDELLSRDEEIRRLKDVIECLS